ncbi:MAG TPA: methyltransferase type 11 [Planctomycetaceae bacterium]|nr:methyltransferase type 11 [Planctomycetaceae bacterium]|tara:strand:+ start:6105 stop:6959 length:855 start_codon:yes stop_codon:yes gene_type:complete
MSRNRLSSNVVILFVVGWLSVEMIGTACAQPKSAAKKKPNSQSEKAVRYTFRKLHDPNGIGKFYMGREIAHVMGYGFNGSGARWLERVEREREEKLALMVRSLKLKPGQRVADIGCGSGVVTALLARAVGLEGGVMGVDVQPQMLARMQMRMKKFRIPNVTAVRGTQKSPRLKPGSIDLAIMVDVYHEFEFPFEMIREIAKTLKPGGRIAFVEYRMEDPKVPILLVHKMTEKQVKKEISQKEFGLVFKETIGVLPRQHIVIFEKPTGKKKAAGKTSAAEKASRR